LAQSITSFARYEQIETTRVKSLRIRKIKQAKAFASTFSVCGRPMALGDKCGHARAATSLWNDQGRTSRRREVSIFPGISAEDGQRKRIGRQVKRAFTVAPEWTTRHVVEETLYVLDVDTAFAVAGKVRKEAYATARPQCASNLIGVARLAFPEQLIEIVFKAVLPPA
jgi:hypothetical protein